MTDIFDEVAAAHLLEQDSQETKESSGSSGVVEFDESSIDDVGKRSGGSATRELTVSTLIHLMGLTTSNELAVLETKVDSIARKVNTLSLKLDRLAKESDERDFGSVLDRIDLQIADLRTLIKKVLPRAIVDECDLVVTDESVLGRKAPKGGDTE